MKKSKAVPLLLLGSTALLAGCTRNPADQQRVQEVRQDAYSTVEACDRDWVDDACVRRGGVYLGPRYFYSHENRTPYVIDSQGRTRAMPGHYGAYNGYGSGAAAAPAKSPERTTIVTAQRSSSISRGGFGGGRSSGSFGG